MERTEERLDVAPIGIVFVLHPAGAQAEPGELVFDVIGHPRGFITNPLTGRHVHTTQSERYDVLAGAMRVELDGRTHLLRAGDRLTVPAAAPHRQLPAGSEPGHVRVTVRPAGRTEQYLRHLAQLARDGEFNRLGMPRPLAGARMLLEFADVGYATFAPLALQRRAASALLRTWREYAFVDQWHVAAPPGAVYDVLVDGRTYPQWWRPVYIDVESDGAPAVGAVSRQHFKGRLPYHLRTRSTLTRLENGRLIEADVDGDLRGHGVWTLTPAAGGTDVRFDWNVHADRPLLRILTPLLRPALRANHGWAIARAIDGLEPYVRSNI
ncbi:MAG TPA: SRPBCC family protein, partial [Solirubrobacteraceae bacterium]|nr:SRPBCC family protein [Solirubrobacteraceae bacterium]